MVITKEDAEGRVIAWAEFRRVNEKGIEDICGDYLWVEEVWIHKDFRTAHKFNAIMKEFINTYAAKYPWCEYIYWTRGKYDERMSLYNRAKMLRRTTDGKETEGTRISDTRATANARAFTNARPI